ncbi:MAG: LON peptidase substrate-binding domain-containing protein [Candidatus Eisenbacteria bacterium]
MTNLPKRPVPVFPLPGVVMFPHAAMPLHIFELRYRTMVRDALSGERAIALATLKPGWEADYHGSPEFHEIGCIATFEQVEWLPNDCYDLRLRGVVRARFLRVAREFPYRACDVEVLPSSPYDEDDPLAAMERDALLETTRKLLPLGTEAWTHPPLATTDAPFEAVVNSIAQSVRLSTELRLELLATDSVFDRARRLHELLKTITAAPPQAPPGPALGHN